MKPEARQLARQPLLTGGAVGCEPSRDAKANKALDVAVFAPQFSPASPASPLERTSFGVELLWKIMQLLRDLRVTGGEPFRMKMKYRDDARRYDAGCLGLALIEQAIQQDLGDFGYVRHKCEFIPEACPPEDFTP
jgi:hypothetical protein